MDGLEMKEIICVRCKRKILVEDDYFKKCCPTCLEKRRAKHAVEYEKTRLLRENDKMFKNETFPETLKSYDNYCAYVQKISGIKPNVPQFIKARQDYLQQQAVKKGQRDLLDAQVKAKNRKDYYIKFLRFDLFEPSDKEKCKMFRLIKMGYYPLPNMKFMAEHLEDCVGCQEWLYNFNERDGFLNRLLVDLDGHPFISEEEKAEFDRALQPTTLEEWERKKGLKDVPYDDGNDPY